MLTGYPIIDFFAVIGYAIVPAIGILLAIGDPTERRAK